MPDPGERVVDLGQRTRDLDGEALRVRERDHADVDVPRRGVARSTPPCRRSPPPERDPVTGSSTVSSGGRIVVAVCVDDLDVAGRAAELGPGLEEGLIARLERPRSGSC